MISTLRRISIIGAMTASISVPFSPLLHADEDALATEEAKVSYALGVYQGEQLKFFKELDYELFSKAMQAQHAGEETLLSMEEAIDALRAFQEKAQAAMQAEAAEKAEKSKEYLVENKARDGVMETDSGLQYEVLAEADGPKPSAEDTVKVHYHGTFPDGEVFDSSVERGEPASFPLNGVIKGWTEGLQLMNVGSKYRFVIPAELAYGNGGGGRPAGTLVFEVELLEIL